MVGLGKGSRPMCLRQSIVKLIVNGLRVGMRVRRPLAERIATRVTITVITIMIRKKVRI